MSLEKMYTNPILEFLHVYKTYQLGRTQVHALTDINLPLPREKIVGIFGPSGSGKSTFLYLAGTLVYPTSGSVLLNGISTDQLDSKELSNVRRNTVGFIFQFENLDTYLNVKENIELPLILAGKPKEVRKHRIDELLDTLEISDLKNRPVEFLSGGQRQLVGIGVALANNPPLLLADEPTGELDSKSAETVKQALKQINKTYGTTILLISHDSTVLDIASQKINIRDGKLQ